MNGNRPGPRSTGLKRTCAGYWQPRRRCRRLCWPSGWAGPGLRRCSGPKSRRSGPSMRRRIQRTGSCMSRARPCSVICGSRTKACRRATVREGKPPVLVMTSTYSGFVQARMIPTRTTEDLLGGMWELLQETAAVPAKLVWDNETGIGRGKLTEVASAFDGVLGTEIRLLPPRDPESKGMVERMNGFFRRGFMPGRDFTDPHDFNDQLDAWLPKANARYARSRKHRVWARP